ncbi:MAG: permease-like cell division protein FtsX [Candidatus Peregrinibacteria bacterium]
MLSMDQNNALLWRRGLKRGIKALRQDRTWMSTLGVLTGSLLLLNLILSCSIAVESAGSVIRERTDLRISLLDSANDQERSEFFTAVNTLPAIRSAVYITKEQAYERMRTQDPELIAFIEQYNLTNPFPDIVSVTLHSPEAFQEIADMVKSPEWKSIADPAFLSSAAEQEVEVRELLAITQAMNTGSLATTILTIALLLLIIAESISRRTRERMSELTFEHSVGASPFTILLPFATEMTIILWGSIVASAVLIVLFSLLSASLLPTLTSASLLATIVRSTRENLLALAPVILLLEIVLAPLLGIAGGFVATHRPSAPHRHLP